MHSVELSHRTVILALSGASRQLREFAVVLFDSDRTRTNRCQSSLMAASRRNWPQAGVGSF